MLEWNYVSAMAMYAVNKVFYMGVKLKNIIMLEVIRPFTHSSRSITNHLLMVCDQLPYLYQKTYKYLAIYFAGIYIAGTLCHITGNKKSWTFIQNHDVNQHHWCENLSIILMKYLHLQELKWSWAPNDNLKPILRDEYSCVWVMSVRECYMGELILKIMI